MSSTTITRRPRQHLSLQQIGAYSAFVAAAAFIASAALQISDLNWVINKVRTVPQHIDMALFVVALAGTLPALAWLGNRLGRIGRVAAGSTVLGQLVICTITTESNIRGIDASWFNAAAAAANLLWVPPLIVLVVLAYRSTVLPRPLAVGLVLAYAGTIPLAPHGGGLLAAAIWAMVGLHLHRADSHPAPVRHGDKNV